MRRRAYPYGRYLIEGKKIDEVGPKLRDFVKDLGFPITKFDVKNEEKGTLIVAVNKKIMELLKQKRPPGRIQMILSGYPIDMPSFREMDFESQRVGIEIYLWPVKLGILLELFILPYMELLNRPEIYGVTESEEEELTDWYLTECIWDEIVPKIEAEFRLKSVHMRA